MATLRRYGLHSNHTTRDPLAVSDLGFSGSWRGAKDDTKLDSVTLTLRGEHRFIIDLGPSESAKLAGWLAYMLTAGPNDRNPGDSTSLRKLADLLDAERAADKE